MMLGGPLPNTTGPMWQCMEGKGISALNVLSSIMAEGILAGSSFCCGLDAESVNC